MAGLLWTPQVGLACWGSLGCARLSCLAPVAMAKLSDPARYVDPAAAAGARKLNPAQPYFPSKPTHPWYPRQPSHGLAPVPPRPYDGTRPKLPMTKTTVFLSMPMVSRSVATVPLTYPLTRAGVATVPPPSPLTTTSGNLTESHCTRLDSATP